MKKEEIKIVISEIKGELDNLKKLYKKIMEKDLESILIKEEVKESIALKVHNFYTGCENIFKLIAKEVNKFISEDWDWHRRLLKQMTVEIKGVRPKVIHEDVYKGLLELLAFRHVVRNIYGYELNAKRVKEIAELTIKIFPRFYSEIEEFCHFLENLEKMLE